MKHYTCTLWTYLVWTVIIEWSCVFSYMKFSWWKYIFWEKKLPDSLLLEIVFHLLSDEHSLCLCVCMFDKLCVGHMSHEKKRIISLEKWVTEKICLHILMAGLFFFLSLEFRGRRGKITKQITTAISIECILQTQKDQTSAAHGMEHMWAFYGIVKFEQCTWEHVYRAYVFIFSYFSHFSLLHHTLSNHNYLVKMKLISFSCSMFEFSPIEMRYCDLMKTDSNITLITILIKKIHSNNVFRHTQLYLIWFESYVT